jgi:hypothetical protein
MSEMSRELLALGFGPRGRFVFGGWAGTRGLVEGGAEWRSERVAGGAGGVEGEKSQRVPAVPGV